jgi:hypothetical protein
MPDANRRDLEIEAILARLRAEIRAGPPSVREEDDAAGMVLQSRRQLDRLWAVSTDRPFLSRPGGWGRVRGALLMPAKWVLRKLMRWYVEPLAVDQRAFNAAVMRALDEQIAWMRAELDRLERAAHERSAPSP